MAGPRVYRFNRKRFVQLRNERQLKLKDLSEVTGIDVTVLSKYYTGALAPTSYDRIAVIADALGVPITELIERTGFRHITYADLHSAQKEAMQ